MAEGINILCSTDDQYVPWCGIMLTSLFENNEGLIDRVFILTAGLNPKNVDAISRLSEKYCVPITIVTIREDLLGDFHVRNDGCPITVATWYRILAPIVLPKEIDKVLYLDCDIIINRPLIDLWKEDLEDFAIGAIPDESSYQKEYYDRLGFPKEAIYVNAGVLLINLKYWREHDVVNRCLDCIRTSANQLIFYDQDTLNKVLFQEKKLLDVTWNLQNGFLWSWQFHNYDATLKTAIRKCCYSPHIIHFSGPAKPWAKCCYHPYTPYFLHYRKLSEWKSAPLIGRVSLKEKISHIKHLIAVRFKLTQPLYILPNQYL